MFKRSAVVEMPASTYDQARAKAALAAGTTTAAVMSAKDRLAPRLDSAKEQWGPALESAKESGAQALHSAKDAVTPLVDVAVAKGSDLLSSDTAHEPRNRAALMLAAAKGQPVVVRKRRWPIAAAFLALGTAIGAAIAMLTGRAASSVTPQTEESKAGPGLDISTPLTEAEPEPVDVLSDAEVGLSKDDIEPPATEPDSGDPTRQSDDSYTKPRANR